MIRLTVWKITLLSTYTLRTYMYVKPCLDSLPIFEQCSVVLDGQTMAILWCLSLRHFGNAKSVHPKRSVSLVLVIHFNYPMHVCSKYFKLMKTLGDSTL